MFDGSWKDLYGRWNDSLDEQVGQEPRQPGHWFSIWRMIISHAWFQQELREWAGYEIRSSRLPDDLAGDLEHEVVLMLAGQLARQRDLGMNAEIAEQTFPAYMGTIVRNCCRQATRKLRRQFLRNGVLPAPQNVADRIGQRQSQVELSMEIEELDDPQRTILLLKMKGMTLKEIALQMQMNYSKVCRKYRFGLRQLDKAV